MVRTFFQLFGKSPFGPLQSHMRKVRECTQEVVPLFDALLAGDEAEIVRIAAHLSELENQADQIKNEIRRGLPKNIFLPVDRSDFLILLGTQDRIADLCEDLGILLTMRPLGVMESLKPDLRNLIDRALEVTEAENRLMDELDELVEASFGGPEADKVNRMVEEIAHLEHVCDRAQWEFARKIFSVENELTGGELWMWLKLGRTLGDLANSAENVGKRLQLMLRI